MFTAGQPHVAYFSMEIALESSIPTYAGGLGVLAGDTIRSAADLGVPMVAVTLLHRKGYFSQQLSTDGWQSEQPALWNVADHLVELTPRVILNLEGQDLALRAWKYEVHGIGGAVVPVFLLDADLPQNSPWQRSLTDFLYGGDERYRLCQEAILGIGGVRILRALGYDKIQKFHMNEGHSSLLTLELLDEQVAQHQSAQPTIEDVRAVHDRCVFTTHTPVPAGHDQFDMSLVEKVLGRRDISQMPELFCCGERLNMTFLAMNFSHYINGVAKRHGEVSRHMFAQYRIDSITNGVHAGTWVSEPLAELFDRRIAGWKQDNFSLRSALSIGSQEIESAHREAKCLLIDEVNKSSTMKFDCDAFTIGFARRATGYKRPDLLFQDRDRLRQMSEKFGTLQVIYSGKAHPRDVQGKELIHRIFEARKDLESVVKVAFLPNYDMHLGKMITAGVDLWLNTPEPPMEASGTSGMKAALNGVPSLSILDGWWIEGCIEGITGWAIGEDGRREYRPDGDRDSKLLYQKLEEVILPMFHKQREHYHEIMKHAIALNGAFFNTERMMQEYVVKAYFQ